MVDLKERVSTKALAKLIGIGWEIDKLEKQLDNPPFGLEREQVQGLIEYQLREKDVWMFILNASYE